jgi:hypothetical protein
LVLVDTVVIANQMDDAFDDRINTLETTFWCSIEDLDDRRP